MRTLRSLAGRGLALAILPLALAACVPQQDVPVSPAVTAAPAVTVAPTAAPAAAPAATSPAATAPSVAPTVAPALPPVTAPTSAPQVGQADAPERISFAPGSTSAVLEGAVIRGERKRYVLWAAAGQQMAVQLTSLEQNGAIVLAGPDGGALPGAEAGRDATSWSGALPATGDYTVEVGPTRGNATYRLTVSITAPVSPAGALRSTDWAAVLSADPALEPGQQDGRLYVSVRGAAPAVAGLPLLDNVVYGDFEGDGREDAAILLNSGGTAGNIGVLVFRDTGAGPSLAAWRNGYKLAASAEKGLLVLREPIYASWEPNCCPSGLAVTSFALRAAGLEAVTSRSEGAVGAEPEVVRAFYDLIRRKELGAAYNLLSDAEQAANPFERWAAGYASTVDLTVEAEAVPGAPHLVAIRLTAVDQAPDGSQVTQRFAGRWEVRWDAARGGWSLASPQIEPAP